MIERVHRERRNTILARSCVAFRGWGLALAAPALIGILGGCGKVKPIHYYQVSYPNSAPSTANAMDVSLVVRNFLASHLYREDHIVYGSTTEEMGTYLNERWAEAPTEMLQNALVRGLRSSGSFRSVMHFRSDSQGDYLISGRLYEFKEMPGNGIQARLSFDMEMREIKSGRIVWTHNYMHDEPAAAKDISSLVAAMDKNVQRGVQEVQASLVEYFKSRPQQ